MVLDLSSPISSVNPSAHGVVLAVLARSYEPLSGRQVAYLTSGRVSQRRVNEVLGQLANAGVVFRQSRPPAKLYELNRDHVAADGIIALSEQWSALLSRIRAELATWQEKVVAAWLFGSAARATGGPDSDIDVLLVRPDVSDDRSDEVWQSQVETLGEHVHAWSGNSCEVLELTVTELDDAVERDDRLVRDLRAHAIVLSGPDAPTRLRPKVRQ